MAMALPTQDARAQFLASLTRIKTAFLADLVPTLNELEFQKGQLRGGTQAVTATQTIRQIAHKLSGIAGSLGYSNIGDSAARVDVLAGEILKAPIRDAELATLEIRLDRLLDLIEVTLDSSEP